MSPRLLAASGTHSPGFDLLLIGHVACALIGFGAIVTSGVQAARLRRSVGAVGAGLRRYFAPGINWVGRALYGVPLFGLALLADSGSRFRLGEGWVETGLVLWALAAGAAETAMWPAERRIQAALLAGDGTVSGGSVGRDCLVVVVLASVLGAVFLVATVVMVARPS